jgi:hypothetical protein
MLAERLSPLLPATALVVPVGRFASVARLDARVGVESVARGKMRKQTPRTLGCFLLADLVLGQGCRDGEKCNIKAAPLPIRVGDRLRSRLSGAAAEGLA